MKTKNVIEVTDDSFVTEVLQSDKPVLVDFWASWCMPCRRLQPHLETLAENYHGDVKVVKLNVDEAGSTAQRYSVRSVPTLMIFQNGQIKDRQVGGGSLGSLESFVQKNIN